jgi:hypothetical protein
LATEQDLKDYPAKQVNLEDGLLHVRAGNGILIPQPSPDGAIRARLHCRERTGFPQLRIRRSGNGNAKNTDYYEVILMIKTGQTAIKEGYVNVTTRGKGKRVGVVPLAEPFLLGSYVDLELSMVGEHLQMLVNGKVAFETNDSTVSTGGFCGVAAYEAWFSNIQVRSFPRGTTPGQAAPAGQVAKSADPRITQLEEAYATAIQREDTPAHLEEIKALNTKYVAALDRALDVATQASNLDGAVALRTEKKRVADAAPLPADESTVDEPLKSLRMIYRTI